MHEKKTIKRNFGPVFDENSKILILGSFPSVKSREAEFFYGHPQNRFWKVLSSLTGKAFPEDIKGKIQILLSEEIALWDVIEQCDIAGSSDSTIENVVPVDIEIITDTADIKAVFCNGTTSFALYEKYLEKRTGIKAVKLPSTSPANAAWSLEKLTEEWEKQIKKYY